MNTKLGLLAATAFVLVAGNAAADPTFGSASLGTYRDCSQVTAAETCDGSGTGQRIVTSQITGGSLSTANTDLTLSGGTVPGPGGSTLIIPNDGSYARGSVDFTGGLDLPVIHGSTFSAVGGQERMNINSFGYQSYLYHGADSAFALTATLSVDNASSSGVPDGALLGGAFPGGAIYTDYVAIWDVSAVAGLITAQDLFNNVFLSPCGGAGVLAVGQSSGTLAAGASSVSVSTDQCAGVGGGPGTPFMVHDGDEILVVAGLQLPVNRGGFADASHTFTTALDTADLSATDIANLQAGLQSGTSLLAGVPEPATWGLMLAGFFGLGSALRRRRAAVAA